jgi:hypothetical protein
MFCRVEMEAVSKTLQYFRSHLNHPFRGLGPTFANLLAEPVRRNRMTMGGGRVLLQVSMATRKQV